MRTTVTLDDDVGRAVEALRRAEGLGTSAAVNALARRGLTRDEDRAVRPFRQRVSSLGPPRMPLDDIGEILEVLEDDAPRR